MFLSFKNNAERRKYGGSAFIEIQYCELPRDISLKKAVALKNIKDWNEKSLYVYVDDIDDFYSDYSDIFPDVDLYGINYYSPIQLEQIIDKIENNKPRDADVLLKWLQEAYRYNGIYILGI